MKAASPCVQDSWGGSAITYSPARIALVPLHVLVALPLPLFAAALTAMLFRPPDAGLPPVDRFAFGLLALAVGLRAVILRPIIILPRFVLVPMVGLGVLALYSLLTDAYDVTAWGVLAARVFVPCAMFVLAQVTFEDERSLRWLERFLLLAFAYLSLTAVASLLGARVLIFPRFILDESLGIHADRARGPFLQAVANGVSLNLLGLLAIDLFRRRRLRGLWAAVLLTSLPLAIIATKTRAVWISFAVSVVWMSIRCQNRRLQKATLALALVACAGVLGAFCLGDGGQSLTERLQEEGPVEFRLAAYQAGWGMFLQKPLTGWGTHQIQAELADQISDVRGESFGAHNGFLQMLMEQGLFGFLFYVWLVIGLFRLGKFEADKRDDLATSIHELWPILLTVYLVNGTFAVMNYQFVNSLLFTFAGVLASAHKRSMARS